MYKMLMKFFRFCGEKNRKKFYRSVVLGVLEALCSSMKIAAAYFAIKAVLEGDFSFGAFALVIGLMLISTIGKTIITRFSQMLQTEGGYDTCAMKRIEIAEHLRYLPMGYFNDTSLGHITSVTTNTLEQMADIATRAVMMILQGSLTTVVIATGMLIFDWRIGLIGLCGIAVFLFVNQFTNKSVAKVANEKLAADRDIVGVVLEYIQGISEIRNYHLVEKNNARLDKAIERKTKNDIRAELAAIPAVGVQMLVCKLTGVAICGASLYFYFDGSMAIHNTIIMLLCSYMIFEMLDMAGIYTALLRIIGKGVDLAEEILNIPQMDIDGEEIHPDNLDMHMEHVSFAYENRKIIDDVTLDIKEKTTTAIVGPSGGGKTTITALLSRFWDVDEGKVTLGGRDVREYDLKSLRNSVAVVLQKNMLFSGTIRENLRWGDPDATDEELVEACRLAQADEFIRSFPNGYDTHIEQGGTNVSGGQRQRLCIARALLKKPKILILDDSTSAVDTHTDALIRAGFRAYIPETTKIIIAQRVASVEDADLILVLDNGRISASGSHESLMRESEIYREIYQQQTRGGAQDE